MKRLRIDFIPARVILRGLNFPIYTPKARLIMGRKRTVQLKKLRVKYAAAANETEKAEILAKARRMSPFVELEEAKAS